MKVEGFCIYCGEEQLETSYWRAGNAYFVRCKNCKATGPSIASTEEEAIKLFNIRHDAAKQMRLEYTKPTTLSQLQAENAKLREQSERLFDKTLELATENSKLRGLCKLCEREAENAKLRESVKRLMTQRDERLAVAEADNAKLRELVADMWFWHYEGHIDSESQERQMLHIDAVIQRMRELGVEVDG